MNVKCGNCKVLGLDSVMIHAGHDKTPLPGYYCSEECLKQREQAMRDVVNRNLRGSGMISSTKASEVKV